MSPQDVIIVGCVPDDPFAIDVARYFRQRTEIPDLISLKQFANSEFCPRFIWSENDMVHVGTFLEGKTIVIVSTCCGVYDRQSLTTRTMLSARAAKDNGADKVYVVQPDLFYSAQDRGPRPGQGKTRFERDLNDYKKFDGQPFSARWYAEALKTSGVDGVVTVHNHSVSVVHEFRAFFDQEFFNLTPAEIYADYLPRYHFKDEDETNIIFCAPDEGATVFVSEVKERFDQITSGRPNMTSQLLLLKKNRLGEREVTATLLSASPTSLEEIQGRDVAVFDDMVRTGATVVETCEILEEAGAKSVTLFVTHFNSSDEVKENLNDSCITEVITTNTLPSILNRDQQGRLRKKMLVLKIEKWLADFLFWHLCQSHLPEGEPLYTIDISSKNPRWASFAR